MKHVFNLIFIPAMKGLLFYFALPIMLAASAPHLSAQCLTGNCRNGSGTFQFANGDTYAGLWLNGQPNGKGTYTFRTKERYEGDFKGGKFDGYGTMYYPDGARYAGGWLNNRKHGAGKLFTSSGAVTAGTWAAGKLNSSSTTTMASVPPASRPSAPAAQPGGRNNIEGLSNCNNTYCRNGRGYYDYPDGSRWVGEFKDGLPFGRGTCYYVNKDRYVGQWQHNAPYGEGVMYFASGRAYGAVWANGSPVKELDSDETVPSNPVRIEASNNVKIWAVIVGVGKYTAMPSLKFSDDDAYRFFSFLKSPEGGALPDDQITVLVDESATRENILAKMRQNFLRADANDVVMLYFSGHGLEGCFLPVDYDGYNNKLRHDEIKNIFKQSKAKHKICLADACHSGSLNSGGLAAKSPVAVSLARYYQAFEDADGGIALLMSSKGEELSLEDHGLRQGVFTYYLLQGLKGSADNNADQLVTIRELYRYVYAKVREYTAGAQNPVLTGDFDDAMPVALRRG
jgi:hypothetical protein